MPIDFHILVILYAKQGQEQALRDALSVLVEPSRNDAGNLRYELFVDQADARSFIFVEHWADPESQVKHDQEGPQIQHFRAHGAAAFVDRMEMFLKMDQVA